MGYQAICSYGAVGDASGERLSGRAPCFSSFFASFSALAWRFFAASLLRRVWTILE
jgi:hypothetical protein